MEEVEGGGVKSSGGEATAPPREVVLISAGASHSVALLSGYVVCSWGRGEDGQLGHGDAEDRLQPTLVSALDGQKVEYVICGADHSTAYSESELQVYSWGWGDFGRLGHGNSSDLFTPQPIKALHGIKIRQITCGDSHCLAVTTNGEVKSWGRNQNGQLGLGHTEDSLLPQKVHAFQGIPVKMVAAGAEHTAAVTEDGHLYGWGWGRYGNLGLGDRNDRLIPERVSANDGQQMVSVACGWRHTITISSSGNLYTYGWSKYGQLGHGDFEDLLIPHRLEALKDSYVSQISGGWRHTVALTSDGRLYGWGWNKFTQVVAVGCLHNSLPAAIPEDLKLARSLRKAGRKAKKSHPKIKPYSPILTDKSPIPPLSTFDDVIKDVGEVLSDVCTPSMPQCVGFVDSGPESSGVVPEQSPSIAQDIDCLVSHADGVHNCVPRSDDVLLSDSEVLALFQATLSYCGPMPLPVVNFDDDALISSLIQEDKRASVGGKQVNTRKKTVKNTARAGDSFNDVSIPFLGRLEDCNVGLVQHNDIKPP